MCPSSLNKDLRVPLPLVLNSYFWNKHYLQVYVNIHIVFYSVIFRWIYIETIFIREHFSTTNLLPFFLAAGLFIVIY